MDRESAERNMKTGLAAGCLALFVFGLAFYVSVLYLA
jgi:hypothetical protein